VKSVNAAIRALLPPDLLVLERGWLSSNNVVFRGRDEAAVVDSGYWTHADQTVELVTRAAGNLPVRLLLNTHLHSDHCGGNRALQAVHGGLRTLIPPGPAQAVREWDVEALTYGPTGQHCPRFGFDATLQPGQVVRLGAREWQIHAAPGHDPHSIILFEPNSGTLISADALWENGFGVVFQELEGERAFDEVADTLALIERLAPAVVIPGHGALFADVPAALARARSRLEAYRADPQRHAAHAAKVLLKFKLLELQQATVDDLCRWAESAPYFELMRRRWFAEPTVGALIPRLLMELARSGAARIEGATVFDH
jgi:glyoxylase-like metal-dependent hydrolase (beta-lactamase superfamily II)